MRVIVVLLLVLALLFAIGLFLGPMRTSFVLFEIRLPRLLIGALAGAGFAVSGTLLQAVSRNALADPGVLGINSGATVGLVLVTFASSRISSAPIHWIPAVSILGSGVAALLIYILSRKDGQVAPTRLLLTGIGVGAVLSGISAAIALQLSPGLLQFVFRWTAGWIWGSSWHFVWTILPWIAVLLPVALWRAPALDAMTSGEVAAIGLGVNVRRERLLLLAVSAGLAAGSVAVAGSFSFIGLLSPHIARKWAGWRHRTLIPAAALAGAILIVSADLLARSTPLTLDLPAGVFVSALGAPYFLYKLVRSREVSA